MHRSWHSCALALVPPLVGGSYRKALVPALHLCAGTITRAAQEGSAGRCGGATMASECVQRSDGLQCVTRVQFSSLVPVKVTPSGGKFACYDERTILTLYRCV